MHKSCVNLLVFAQWGRVRRGTHFSHVLLCQCKQFASRTIAAWPGADWDTRFCCVLAPLGVGYDLGHGAVLRWLVSFQTRAGAHPLCGEQEPRTMHLAVPSCRNTSPTCQISEMCLIKSPRLQNCSKSRDETRPARVT